VNWMKICLALATLALSHAAAVAAAKVHTATPPSKIRVAAPAKVDWLATARRTSEGAIVVGNPAARVKLVEYLSLTCPHCAVFSAGAMAPLQRDYIAKGLVSLEVRHAVRDGYDFVASTLLRCEAPARYLGSIEALYATQGDWMAKGANARNADGFEGKSEDEKLAIVARSAGFDSFFAKRGMTERAFGACLTDKKAKDQLAQMAANSWDRDKIPGTPLILVNGERRDDIREWAQLEPVLKAALK